MEKLCVWSQQINPANGYKARVKKQVDVRSHDVRAEDGRVSRRNKRHHRSSKAPVCSRSNPVSLSMPDGMFTAPLCCCRETQHKSKSCRCFNNVYACEASGFASNSQWSDLHATPGSRVGLAGFLQIPGGMVSWTPPRISGGIPGGIGGILVGIAGGIPGGMPPGMFHNPRRDPSWDPAYFWRDPTWD